ncbi:MAG: glucuronate isomerase [Spirochaetes bacterium]|nr:MAG: glucuronate isomerase [Spirochaetota bacterium]
MKPFITDTFLLESDEAGALYHGFAKDMPIIDYHCHLSPGDIADDRRFESITELWLEGDHYKWRAIRANGVEERLITGDAGPWEKFQAWAATVPRTLGNPLYHWTHLELARCFGIADTLLCEKTAREIYECCNAALRGPEFGARGLVRAMKVETVCTTDDPADSLEHHARFDAGAAGFKLYPAWRPDRALRADDPALFNAWLDALGKSAGARIETLGDMKEALRARQDFFHAKGCRLADHGVETLPGTVANEREASRVFAKARGADTPGPGEMDAYRGHMLDFLARLNHRKGWGQQLHMGVLRNVNTRRFRALGPDSGFDMIGDFRHAAPLAAFLDRLDADDSLTRTILYPVNPSGNEVIASVIGCFQDASIPGKMQFGSAWWFLDQKDGMERQMRALASMGLLSRFVGMTTDSRSLLSYPRHEYFRRILCNMLGEDMRRGLIPDDLELVGGMVGDICYHNAKAWFGFP